MKLTNLYTIGFTKKTAEQFFDLLKDNQIKIIVDVRLNNTSQLAGFSKFPDLPYFLDKLCECDYILDKNFAPSEDTLSRYKKNKITWSEYEDEFANTMESRNIEEYIRNKYSNLVSENNICFLCSEDKPNKCHRRLVAELFADIFNKKIIHII